MLCINIPNIKKKIMYILFTLSETIYNGYLDKSIILIDAICVIVAILTIISKNPIVSVLFLISLFLGIAIHLLISGLSFIGLSYLLVYVGAVSILFLFILMLINIRISELLSETSNVVALNIVTILLFNYAIYEIFFYNFDNLHRYLLSLYNVINYSHEASSDKISFVSSKLWDGSLAETTDISTIGSIMYTGYSIWLIITSIILLLAMVGAIVITIKQS